MDVAPERQTFSETRRKQEREGRLSFAYFSFGEAKKSEARGRRNTKANH